MSRCLRDEELWFLHEGGGNERQRAHVAGCAKCATRLRRLGDDVRILSRVLREAPPAVALARSQRRVSWRWVPVVAAGAAIAFALWNGVLTEDSPRQRPTVSSVVREKEIVEVLEKDVYAALFTNEDLDLIAAPTRVSTLAYVQAALDGGWPCERAAPRQQTICDQRPIFLVRENR